MVTTQLVIAYSGLVLLIQAVSCQQIFLSLGQTTITTNNTEILITDIGEDAGTHGLPSLTCNTDLTACCRNSDTGGNGGRGQWHYPDGSLVLNNAGSTAAGELFYFLRNAPQVIRLHRRDNTNPLSPTGSYCCTVPTTGGEMTFCASLVVCRSLPELTNGMISYSDPTLGLNTMATHSCDLEYTLSGDSVRSCGNNGVWNGSPPTCQDSSLKSTGMNEFVVAFAENYRYRSDQEFLLYISSFETIPSAFEVTANAFSFSGVVDKESITNLSMPHGLEVQSINDQNNGILIKANGINVYGLSSKRASSDAFLALPCQKIAVDEYEYYGVSYDNLRSGSNNYPSFILIAACDNNTIIKIPSKTIILNRLETYLLENTTADLTGMRITASKPISVFSGSNCANVPRQVRACDHLVEQIPPTYTWGTRFLVASLMGRRSGERIRLLSVRHSIVNVTCNNGTFYLELTGAGNFSEIEINPNSFCSIEASSPILVTQYAKGYNGDRLTGDPFMMIIPPVEQFINNYMVEAFSKFSSNFLTLYVSPEYFQPELIFVDDKNPSAWINVSCSNGEVCGYIARMNVTGGSHSISHVNKSARLSVSVYGFLKDDSYGYPGGMRLAPIQCNCDQNAICHNNDGHFNCTCMDGFTGDGHTCIGTTVCGSPPSISNGSPGTPTSTTFGVTATYSCDYGHQLFGLATVTCHQASRSWSTPPTCYAISCGSPPSISNGSPGTPTSTTFGGTITYSCHYGHQLSGSATVTCQASGSWSTPPSCPVADCESPRSPSNGRVNFDSTLFSSFAHYSCDSCYQLRGVSAQICDGSGVWIPMPPTCEIIDCGSPPDLVNGRVGTPVTTSCSSVVSYSCDSGYLIEGVGSRICQTNGSWSGADIVCKAINCGNLSNPSNGLVWTSGTIFMSTATYSCNTGYELRGVAVRTCGAAGLWTPSQPSCEPVNCGSLGPPINGQVDISQGTTYQKVATYSCNTGYNLIGTSTRICRANGVWSSSQPTCRVVDCGLLDSPTNGHLTLSATIYNSVAVYLCNEGYLLNGRASRTCLASGQWSPSQPTCDPVSCGDSELSPPLNGRVDTSQGTHFMDTITYSCDPGYNLTGCSVSECQANRTWSCNPPYCADNKMIQFKFGPTRYCVEWTSETVELMYKVMYILIAKATGGTIPVRNIQNGYFSCYGSVTKTTYRTTITGTERVSAADYTDMIQEWVESGVTTRVLWYVIKLDKSCPVAISSMEVGECVN